MWLVEPTGPEVHQSFLAASQLGPIAIVGAIIGLAGGWVIESNSSSVTGGAIYYAICTIVGVVLTAMVVGAS